MRLTGLLFILLISLFIFRPSLAETTLDFEADPKIKIDEHYKCHDFDDESFKLEIGFHRVNGKMFSFLVIEGEGYEVWTSARVFNSKFENRDVVSYILPFPTKEGLGNLAFVKNFYFKGEKTIYMDWIKDDSSIDWVNNHWDLQSDRDENFDQKLIDYSEEALDHIFRVLEFGEPFEPDDIILSIPEEKTIGGYILVCK